VCGEGSLFSVFNNVQVYVIELKVLKGFGEFLREGSIGGG
jgi:hypothetical protein